MIPDYNLSGVLPPFVAGDPTVRANMSPYRVDALEVVRRFGITEERKAVLRGFLEYREALMRAGVTQGFQWLNGSFVEDIETIEKRAPNDVDVVTFFQRPTSGKAHWREWSQANRDLFDPRKTKLKYKSDVYGVDLNNPVEHVVDATRYWFGLFSHRRLNSLWKGMLHVPLNASDDAKAAALLKRLST